MRIFSVDEDVFKVEPLFVMDCSHEEMRKYLNKRFDLQIETEEAAIRGQMLTFGKRPWRVVWVKSSSNIPVIVHETFHLVTRVCQDRGIPIVSHHPDGQCGDETAAYLLDFYVRHALKLRRNKRKISA